MRFGVYRDSIQVLLIIKPLDSRATAIHCLTEDDLDFTDPPKLTTFKLAIFSSLAVSSLIPVATAALPPFPSSTHFMGPIGKEAFGGIHVNMSAIMGSRLGCIPCW